MSRRIEGLRSAMDGLGIDGYFSLSRPANAWLSGFFGSTSAVVVTRDAAHFLCDFRYGEVAAEQCAGYAVSVVTGKLEERVAERLDALGVKVAGFDPSAISFAQYQGVWGKFGGELRPAPGIVDAMRAVKDREEIRLMCAANDLAEEVLAEVKLALVPGVTEREIAAKMIYGFQMRGADKPSFDPIVLFGSRSSLPHGVPSDRALKAGDIVLIDMGCERAGYCSDLTRTYVFGRIPDAWFSEVYGVTLQAHCAALDALRGGVVARDVDAAAREIIKEAGFGECFGHGTGHGIGLEVHESIRLNAQSNMVLEPGMAVTIEPGIYLPGKGGVRIEDLVIVTENGYDGLTQSPKELEVLGV